MYSSNRLIKLGTSKAQDQNENGLSFFNTVMIIHWEYFVSAPYILVEGIFKGFLLTQGGSYNRQTNYVNPENKNPITVHWTTSGRSLQSVQFWLRKVFDGGGKKWLLLAVMMKLITKIFSNWFTSNCKELFFVT